MIYQCERCGATGVQEAGMYNLHTKKYDAPAGKCDGCAGHGFLLPLGGVAELVQLFNQLEREIAALKAAREWRDIATAPKDGTEVMILDCWGNMRVGIVEDGAWASSAPTHWMPKPPLPEPPTEDAGS